MRRRTKLAFGWIWSGSSMGGTNVGFSFGLVLEGESAIWSASLSACRSPSPVDPALSPELMASPKRYPDLLELAFGKEALALQVF